MNFELIIGENIRKKREEKNVKLESLARHLGVSKARMSQIEHGECKELTISRIQKIAEYLDVNIREIVDVQTQLKDGKIWESLIDGPNAISAELIKLLADELVKRIKS